MKGRDGQAVLLGLASLAAGCAPTLEALSAGRVGCAPRAITISAEDDQPGSRTWVATCRGRRYQCSITSIPASPASPTKAAAGSSTAQVATASSSQSEIACTPLGGASRSGSSPSGAKGTPDGKDERAGDAAGSDRWQPLLNPPDSAGGFVLGSDPAAASKVCTDAGMAWKDFGQGLSRCSGTPVDLGFQAWSRLELCDRALCGVTLVVSLEDEDPSRWVGHYAVIRRALARKYGSPTKRTEDIPSECWHTLPRCLAAGAVTLDAQWSWDSGQSIRMAIGRAGEGVRIGIVFRRGRPTVNPKVDDDP